MKHYSKMRFIPLFIGMALFLFSGCDDKDEHISVPVAPILKNVVYPSQDNIIPGQPVQIEGLGFSKDDKVFFTNDEGTIQLEVVESTDSYIKIIIPIDAGGEYSVSIERAGKTSVLANLFSVPFVVPITDIELPKVNIAQQGEVLIAGRGFEDGDVAKLTASFYPAGLEYNVPMVMTDDGAKFTLPQGVYGVNSVVIIRENRRSNIGAITIETNVGDVLGGGIVYWVDVNKAHGYIAAKTNAGTSQEQWGPERDPVDATGTSKAMGSGKNNTRKAVAKMAAMRAQHGWPEWANVKIAAELCDEFTVTEGEITYADWFLPSQEELVELFKVKAMMAEKGGAITGNNFWTSSEGDDDGTGWSAYHVNFYEDTNLVSYPVSKSGWKIGVRPVRSF